MEKVATATLWEIFILAWLFVGVHTVLSWMEHRERGWAPWWRTILGWLLTLAVASLGTVFTFLVAVSVWPVLATYRWFLWAYLLSFQLVALVLAGKIVARIWLYVRARHPKQEV